ncbi:PolC-type DNA polymerase III [Dehalobacterium formicoaceticum]|uniref:DNA polymerase III PolC-type n=1 Tax=Dehalobacterium formicoaceticum TaxID=51515 RepID=A0ABT1Y1J5_9FIRM|nr:PolC-type DNA polymerase III [Dehalobacterium formicoaceticum]MCR6544710.1 PolC-type DNA polymerase III [Dehalobacterium formicoaceticum]
MTDLNDLIAQCGLPRETKAVFRQMQVKKARISRKKRSLTLVVELPCPISEEDVGFFCALIQENLPAFQEVVLEVMTGRENYTLAQVIEKERGVLLETLEEKVAGVKNWLHMAKWQCADLPAPDGSGLEGLILTFPHPFAVEILEEKKLPQILGSLMHFRYGLDVPVELKLDDEAEENYEEHGREGDKDQEAIPYEEIDRAALLQYCAVSDSSSPAASRGEGKKAIPTQGDVILGKVIKGEPIPLEKIREEERSAVVMGRIISLATRELRSGRTLIIFDLTDDTDSISVKLFTDEKTPDKVFTALKKGAWVKVRGPVQTDKYSQELTLMAYDISTGQAVEREDHAPEKRVELHLHTKMSSLDAVVDTSRVVALAAKWGHRAIAITDHGVVQAFPEAYQAGKEHKIKIIYGVEGYLIDDEETDIPWQKQKSHHIIILVKNQGGLLNLYRLISLSHLETYYRKPRILKSVLQRHREGLILGSACEAGELYRAILNKKTGAEIEGIAQFYDYLEIQPLGNNEFLVRNDQVPDRKSLMEINKTIIALGEKHQKPVAATGDVHFIEEGDAIYRKILMAGKGFEDDIQAPLYFRTTEEMLAEFSYLGEETAQKVVIRDPNWIAEQIEDVLPIPQELYPPEIEGAEEQVEEMTWGTARSLYGETLPNLVQARIDKELNSIIKHGFSVLYLIAHKLVKKSNDDGYLVGSRGSVGSSMVATMMGITEVNPLPPHYRCPGCCYSRFITDGSLGSGPDLPDEDCPRCGKALVKDGHDIPFETFLGFEGDKTPDIDLNFSGDYQPRAHKYVEELFGKDHVFRAGTISTIAERTAFGFVKNYLTDRNLQARDAEVNRLVSGCSGVKRTTGQHPGGLMVVPTKLDIHKFSPIQHPADDMKSDIITTHFDYHSISDRLVKLDILGHDDPTMIKMLEDLTGIDAKNIKLDDQETLSLFSGVEILKVTPKEIRSNVGTYGVPEFGTKFVRQMLEDIRPSSFSDLVRISGFSHGTDVWLNNAQELIRSGTCKTSETISCRDDIMVYLMQKGLEPQIAFKIMEDVRKGKGVKPEYEGAMKSCQVPDWYIDSCKRIKYMFPKAHATAYVTMAYRIAWFKVNFPEAFYASFFSVRADEFDADLMVRGVKGVLRAMDEIEGKGNEASTKEKNLLTILEVVLEMYQRGIDLLPVSLENSAAEKFHITDRGILPPLSSLQGLGVTAAHNLVAAREEKPFCTWDDIRLRGKASKTVIDMMAAHGCLDHLPESSQMCLF